MRQFGRSSPCATLSSVIRGPSNPANGAETAPNRRSAGIWPEGERPDRSIRPSQPGSDHPTVNREGGAEHRAVRLDATPVRVAARDDDPDRDRRRRISWADPAAIDGDPDGVAPFAIDGPDKLVDVGDVGLELNHQEGSQPRMPGEDVDDPALAVDRERHLGLQDPLWELFGEVAGDQLVKLGVPGIQQTIEIPGAPPSREVDPDLERCRDSPKSTRPSSRRDGPAPCARSASRTRRRVPRHRSVAASCERAPSGAHYQDAGRP